LPSRPPRATGPGCSRRRRRWAWLSPPRTTSAALADSPDYRPCGPRKRADSRDYQTWWPSALRRAERQAGDELLLEKDVDQDRRHRRQQRAGGHQVVVHEDLALQVVQRARDRPLVAVADEDERPEEVVVDEGEQERGHRRERRP